MDKVIVLQDRRTPRQAKPVAAGTTAEVIIFPGVRFERLTDEMMQSTIKRHRIPSLHNHAIAEALE